MPESAERYIAGLVGPARPVPDASLDAAIAAVGPSLLAKDPLFTTEAEDRLFHARGQSLPDWIALRSGCIGAFPDGVAYPASGEDIRACLDYARRTGASLIPYGGGTSVAGHINPRAQDRPVLTVDLSRMNRLLSLDEESRLATFEAGIAGPEIERRLAERGFTLGHFPQSWELSTLGGWIATRSSGQQSYCYGRIEQIFAGGHVETPGGALDLPAFPASAAGPDLRQAILGSEGRFGFITRATVRVRPLPETETFHGIFFRSWENGAAAVRAIVQAAVPVSMLRLSDPQETDATLHLSGKETLAALLDRGLRAFGYGGRRSLLILGVTGDRRTARFARRSALAIARRHGGFATGQSIGRQWNRKRFLTPYLRNTLWERGYAIDTLETAMKWSTVIESAVAVKEAIRHALDQFNERVLVFAHLSHVYTDGASIYVTYLWRRGDPERMLAQWSAVKAAASAVIVGRGGTISHQHGVGLDHAPYLQAEKGVVGIRMLEALRGELDRGRILNRGKLIE